MKTAVSLMNWAGSSIKRMEMHDTGRKRLILVEAKI